MKLIVDVTVTAEDRSDKSDMDTTQKQLSHLPFHETKI